MCISVLYLYLYLSFFPVCLALPFGSVTYRFDFVYLSTLKKVKHMKIEWQILWHISHWALIVPIHCTSISVYWVTIVFIHNCGRRHSRFDLIRVPQVCLFNFCALIALPIALPLSLSLIFSLAFIQHIHLYILQFAADNCGKYLRLLIALIAQNVRNLTPFKLPLFRIESHPV